MSEYRVEICLSGSGGQGLILAGIILAEAAGIYSGLEVVQTQSYGPEARGGASRSEIVISNEKIDYPKVLNMDILLALTQKACDTYIKNVKKDGILLVDSTNVSKIPKFSGKSYQYPITKDAIQVIGNQLVTNILSLGIVVQLSKVVSREAVENALHKRIPERFRELDQRALDYGFAIGEKIQK
ncbi:MAG: 2-oxoacid:acceptor oxidoreductase family protein [Candidatus Atribacteria bacterium]|nr:2-oxoacid:acceptor oxidoreductase family protein [Candidatus Atribacteria bacterium]